MSGRERSRREFLRTSLTGVGAAWAVANAAGIEEASAFVQQATRDGQAVRFSFFTPAQAMEIEAMAARSSRPTPRPAPARRGSSSSSIGFSPRSRRTRRGPTRKGLRSSQPRRGSCSRRRPPSQPCPRPRSNQGAHGNGEGRVLQPRPDPHRHRLLRRPLHGGNQGKVGWALLHYDDALKHTPPFGYYDALPGSTSR